MGDKFVQNAPPWRLQSFLVCIYSLSWYVHVFNTWFHGVWIMINDGCWHDCWKMHDCWVLHRYKQDDLEQMGSSGHDIVVYVASDVMLNLCHILGRLSGVLRQCLCPCCTKNSLKWRQSLISDSDKTWCFRIVKTLSFMWHNIHLSEIIK